MTRTVADWAAKAAGWLRAGRGGMFLLALLIGAATVPIWRKVRAAPNGAFQNAGSPGGGPSCGPTYRYASAM